MATLALAQEMNDRQNIAQAHNTLGICYVHTGQYQRALGAFLQALEIYQALNSAYQEANTRMHIALTLNAQGNFGQAAISARQALERSEALHAQRLKAEALNALAEAALGASDHEHAASAAQAAALLSHEIGSSYDEGIAQRLLGQIAAQRGEPYDSRFAASIALFEVSKNRFELARTWAAYGAILYRDRNETAGRAYLKQARNAFLEIGANGELQRLPPDEERNTYVSA
jgi:tetratricopeptide (TPR) repeat protein